MQNPFFLNALQALQAHQMPNPPQPSNEGLPSPQCVRSGPRGKGLDWQTTHRLPGTSPGDDQVPHGMLSLHYAVWFANPFQCMEHDILSTVWRMCPGRHKWRYGRPHHWTYRPRKEAEISHFPSSFPTATQPATQLKPTSASHLTTVEIASATSRELHVARPQQDHLCSFAQGLRVIDWNRGERYQGSNCFSLKSDSEFPSEKSARLFAHG